MQAGAAGRYDRPVSFDLSAVVGLSDAHVFKVVRRGRS
jgi:hypothetical protein